MTFFVVSFFKNCLSKCKENKIKQSGQTFCKKSTSFLPVLLLFSKSASYDSPNFIFGNQKRKQKDKFLFCFQYLCLQNIVNLICICTMKKIFLFLLILIWGNGLLLANERNAFSLNSRMIHNGTQTWKMLHASETAKTGAEISSVGYNEEGWMEAAVPGTVLGSLVENKVYPEPYYGMNNKLKHNLIPDLAKVGRDFYTYWFRTEFLVPEQFRNKRVWLEPQGINYRAEIWVNGRLVDVMAGMFCSHDIDITERVKPGEKAALAIKVFPVDVPGTTKPKSWGAAGEYQNGGDGWIGLNVTQLMTVGWDFTYEDGIRDRNTGIWKQVRLYATGNVQLRAPMVKSKLEEPAFNVAHETVSVEVYNPNTYTYECHVKARIPEVGVEIQKEVKLMRGEHRIITFTPEEFPELTLKNPKLWWPINKGPQNLYTLQMTVRNLKNDLLDSIQTRFGIRDVKALRDTPDKSKVFVINGHRMFVRGSNWIPEAMLRTDDARMETELAYTAQSGINLLRLWGGGIAESDRFYELCDEYGLMVWQEFWMTGDTKHPMDENIYLANVASTVKRIRNHPSIIFYVSSNESTEVSGAKELLEELDGTRPYQMQSECDGVHDGSPYKQVNPMRHYENTASDRGSRVDGFNPEYGAPTLPIVESLRKMMPENELWPINKETWDYMDGNGFHLMTTLYDEMVNEYGPSKNIEQYARKGQMVGAMNSKSIWEVWNENKLQYGDRWCSGLLFWYHNCPNMQVCARMWDWMLQPTASLYHTMNALEPLHVQYDYLTNTVSVVNDWLQPQTNLTATAEVYDFESRKRSCKTAKVEVPADGVANDVLTVDFPTDLTQVHFIALKLQDQNGKVLSRNFYWRSLDKYEGKNTTTGPCTSGFEDLNKLKAAQPKVRITAQEEKDGKKEWKIQVKNNSKRIAFFTQLLLTDTKGNAIDRTYYSDNFISLLPGEAQTIVVRAPKADLQQYLLKVNEGLHPTRTYSMPK